jgi:hypothetical protein
MALRASIQAEIELVFVRNCVPLSRVLGPSGDPTSAAPDECNGSPVAIGPIRRSDAREATDLGG